MDIFVTFNNRQVIVGEIRSESNVESVGVHADGKNPESVAIALMTAIECLVIEPIDIVYWLFKNLPNKEQKDIKRAIVSALSENQDAVETIEPIEVVEWLIQDLPQREQIAIKRAIISALSEGQDAVEIAVEAVSRLKRDEQEKIATDILAQWGEVIVKSYAAEPESGQTNEPL